MNTILYYIAGLLINLPFLLGIALSVATFVYLLTKSQRSLRYLVGFLVPFLAIQMLPFGRIMITNLESKIERPATLPTHIDGLIFLGGTINGQMTRARGLPVANLAGVRLYEFIELVMAHPEAKVVISGTPTESKHALETLLKFNIARERIIVEDASTSTIDNVNKSYDLVHPKDSETWVMVTSASHIYRANLLFKLKNWKVIPYPVNYVTSGKIDAATFTPDGMNALAWHVAMKEYLATFML